MAGDKQIYVPITLGVDSYKKELATAATATQQSGEIIATSAQKASEANLSAAKSTKTLQQEYKIAAKEAQKLAQIHGLNNAATIEAAARAAEYKDRLDDVNDRINAFHPEKRFTLAAQGMSAALSVVQAGVGIFQSLGISSQSAEKAITAMMAIQGLATALQNVEAMKGAYQAIAVMVKTQVIPSLVTMNGVIMASGIIALVAVVAALAYNWYQTSKAQEEAAKSLREYNATLQKTAQAEQDLYVETLQGRAKEQARLNNEATKKITEYYQQIKAIEEKASEESRSLTKAEQLEITSLRKQAVLVNEGLLVAQREQNKKFRDEDLKALEIAGQERIQLEKDVNDSLAKIRAKKTSLAGLTIGQKPILTVPTRLNLQMDTGQATQTGKSQIAIMYEEFKMGIKAGNQSLEELVQGMGKSLKDAAVSTFANVGQAVGQGIAAGFDGSGFDSFAKMMGQTLAALANQIGLSLIAFGTPLLFVPGTQLQGLAYVAGGTAMIAAGSFISAKLGGGASGGGGSTSAGGSSGGPTTGWSGTGGINTGFGGMSMQLSGGAKITGRDLQLVYGREGYFSRRVTGK